MNGITICSDVFAGLTVVAARQTDRPHYSISSNRLHLASAAMRPNNTQTSKTRSRVSLTRRTRVRRLSLVLHQCSGKELPG